MTDDARRQQRIRENPDYPPDYGDYLDEAYDATLGRPSITYEQWKERRTTASNRGGE